MFLSKTCSSLKSNSTNIDQFPYFALEYSSFVQFILVLVPYYIR